MKIKLILWSAIFLSLCCTFSYAQPNLQNIKPLKIGDQCPDFVFSNIIKYPQREVKLSNLKGKIVILDFWGTWCGSCIEAMPQMDKVQQQFKNDLVILPVTDEKADYTQKFISSHRNLDTLHLPSVTQNKELNRYFPHSMVPHEVWIDKEGRVMAISSDLDVTSENVSAAITTGKLAIAEKKDLFVNYMKPFFAGYFSNYEPSANLIKYENLVTGYVAGSPGLDVVRVLPDGNVKRTITNWHIAGLFKVAFQPRTFLTYYKGDFSEYLPSRVFLEVRDSSIFFWPGRSEDSWDKIADSSKCFCYEQIVPYKDSVKMNEYMQRDLNSYFGSTLGITAFKAKRKVKCWVLERLASFREMKDSDEKPSIEWGTNEEKVKVINEPLRIFILQLLMYHLDNSPIPIINEVDYKGPVNFDIQANLLSPAAIGKALEKYGLTFRLEERNLDMLVIKDTK